MCTRGVWVEGSGAEHALRQALCVSGSLYQWSRLPSGVITPKRRDQVRRSWMWGGGRTVRPTGHTPQARTEAIFPRLRPWVVVQPRSLGSAPRAGPPAFANWPLDVGGHAGAALPEAVVCRGGSTPAPGILPRLGPALGADGSRAMCLWLGARTTLSPDDDPCGGRRLASETLPLDTRLRHRP